MGLNVFNKTQKRINLKFCKKIDSVILRELGKNTEVSLVFVSEREMKRLNSRYRKKNKVTNVLSFAFFDDKNFIKHKVKEQYLGEVVICLNYAAQEAKKYGWSPEKNLARLIIHGLLHLHGFDHKTKKEREKMENFENKTMNKLKYD